MVQEQWLYPSTVLCLNLLNNISSEYVFFESSATGEELYYIILYYIILYYIILDSFMEGLTVTRPYRKKELSQFVTNVVTTERHLCHVTGSDHT